jgi:hypothetical protein
MAINSYAAGAAFVVHQSGKRLTRFECERIRSYLNARLSEAGWSDTLVKGWTESLSSLDAAIAASWPEVFQEAAQ